MIISNIPSVMRQVETYKIELKADVKLTRDEMAATALGIMKKTLSRKSAYTGRGANKKYVSTAAGAPPAKQSGLLFRSAKARKWNKEDKYGAYVGLPKRSPAFYGVILESSNRTGKGNAFSGKRRASASGRASGKGAYPQRAPGVHKWAEPSFRQFQPLVNPIIEKNLGRVR